MVVNEVINTSGTILLRLGEIGLWVQALGIAVVLWIVFQIIGFILNSRRMREIYEIRKDMKRMESKLDKLMKKR